MPMRAAGLRRWSSVMLLALLCLGSGAHFLHHLTDRDCDADGRRGSVPCTVCSVLHGGAIAPRAEIVAPQCPAVIARLLPAETERPEIRGEVAGAPRAPPAA